MANSGIARRSSKIYAFENLNSSRQYKDIMINTSKLKLECTKKHFSTFKFTDNIKRKINDLNMNFV